jgi:hypothetical protein
MMAGGIGSFLGVGKGRRKKEEEELRRQVENEVKDGLWKALKNKDKEHLRFICAHDIEQIWTLPRIAQLSKGLNWATPELQTRALKHFLKIMSILIWINWDYWDEFGRFFLEHRDAGRNPDRRDKHLPLLDTSFLQTEELRINFRDQQYLFIPVIIMEDDEDAPDIDIYYSEKYSEKHRMPFLETQTIGEGSSGTVTREVIPPGYLLYRRGVANRTVIFLSTILLASTNKGF